MKKSKRKSILKQGGKGHGIYKNLKRGHKPLLKSK